jgi:translation initiation factor 2 beta subunit (eIF-2beta)/eIF-5
MSDYDELLNRAIDQLPQKVQETKDSKYLKHIHEFRVTEP